MRKILTFGAALPSALAYLRRCRIFGAAVQALLSGDVDMVLMDAASSRGYVGANPDKLKVIGDPISSEDYGFIFPPKSDLVAPFNAAIETMKKDGYLDHLNTRWFISEIFRAGVESIGRGQMEAARSLGTSYWQAMRYIVLPQAIRNVLPPLGNDIIAMLKDSSWCPSWGTGHHSTRQGLLGQHVPRL